MQWIRFKSNTEEVCHGLLEGETIREVAPLQGDWDLASIRETGRTFELAAVKLLAPCQPSKVVCIGLNYRSHAEEVGQEIPKIPIIFMKPSTAVIGPQKEIIYPPQSRRVDYEAELAVVIGRKAHRVKSTQALNYVFGYTCGNDVTARDKQPARGQWTYAKGFDTFCPLGPVINTAIRDPEKLSIKGVLNGKTVQSGNTADHIFSVAELIEFISGCMTLLPGDVILTGTPAGIGPMQPGDTFSVIIEGIGTLTNTLTG
ncbi:MAG TPA: fumarylacetoacetate hydrolase family protein [Bacillota bacterium]|mgnify:CR=1 FL=1|nr:fumarylacetoacetate hydrolase family protein [Bacillota bacterium]